MGLDTSPIYDIIIYGGDWMNPIQKAKLTVMQNRLKNMYESMNYFLSLGDEGNALKMNIKIKMQKERIASYRKEIMG